MGLLFTPYLPATFWLSQDPENRGVNLLIRSQDHSSHLSKTPRRGGSLLLNEGGQHD